MNATISETERVTGVWAHGMQAIAEHAVTHHLPRPEQIDTSQHPSGQMVLTVYLARTALAAWLDTVQVIDEATEYRHPAGQDAHLRVFAQVRLPDSNVVVMLSGSRAYAGALSLVGVTR